MTDALFLAWQHLRYHWGRTILLMSALVIVTFLPLAVEGLVVAGEKSLRSRAVSTPLVAGPEGSPLDVVLGALYYQSPSEASITWGSAEAIGADGHGDVIPLSLGERAGGAPLVGTNVGYFAFRELEFAEGRSFAVLGECVLGSKVAADNNLAPGDKLTTEPRNMLDLAGAYPIRMRVVGVLAPADGPDDEAVFTDLRTTWVVQGLGHGHEDLAKAVDPELILGKTENGIIGSAKVREYVEFDETTIDSVHFHGDQDEFPVTAAIVVPESPKSRTILLGRADSGVLDVQVLEPTIVVETLLVEVFRVRKILFTVLGVVAMAMAILVAVVIALSIRIRAREIETMHLVGCAPGRVGLVLGTEIFMLVGGSVFVAAAASAALFLSGSFAVRLFTS
ncbi:MAG: hypothetical protein MK085_01290 [Phycisphaerales bacterium]|nr:hypothetical protein [Phycisphaerales bacterium]